jgi:hypothetical protein
MTTRVNFLGKPFATIVSDAELSAEDSRRVTAARQRARNAAHEPRPLVSPVPMSANARRSKMTDEILDWKQLQSSMTS